MNNCCINNYQNKVIDKNYHKLYFKYKKKYIEKKKKIENSKEINNKLFSINFYSKNINQFTNIFQKGSENNLLKDVNDYMFINLKPINVLEKIDLNSSLVFEIDSKIKIFFYFKDDEIIYRLLSPKSDDKNLDLDSLLSKLPKYKIKNDLEKINYLIKDLLKKNLIVKTEFTL